MEQRSNLPALFTRPSWALGRFGDWPSEFERFFDDFARRRWPAVIVMGAKLSTPRSTSPRRAMRST